MSDRSGHEGQRLGNYYLLRLLGQGGFARVYLGEHIELKRQAAIKVLDTKVVDQEDIEKFRIEARTIANLRHPNIVQVLDFAVEGNTPFLVMDFAPNGSLAKLHPRGTRLPLHTIISYVKQVAAALQHAHDKNLIHCDVKPANMLVGRNNEILLSDFGIALTAPTHSSWTSGVERLERIAGTWPYMAPEHLEGKPNKASDQYSLGIVVYEWLCGEVPFHGSHDQLYIQHHSTPPPSLVKRVPGIPVRVEQVVMKALEKDRQQRFQRIEDFAEALEAAVSRPVVRPTLSFPSPGAGSGTLPQEVQSPARANAASPLVVGSDTNPASPTALTELAPATPFPEETTLQVHPLIQQQRDLIQQLHDVLRDYNERKEQVRQRFQEEERAILEEQQREVAVAEREIGGIRTTARDTHSLLHTNGWGLLTRNRLFLPEDLKDVLIDNPRLQMAECQSEADKARKAISAFLRKYPGPLDLYKKATQVAGISTILGAVIFGFLCQPLNNFGSVLLLTLGITVAATLGFFLSRLYPIRNAYVRLEQVQASAEAIDQQRRSNIEETYQSRLNDLQKGFRAACEELEQKLAQWLTGFRSRLALFTQEVSFSGTAWEDPIWKQWNPLHKGAPVARIGTLTARNGNAQPGLPTLPALVSCPNGYNILMKTARVGRGSALAAVKALIVRLLVTQPPGKVRFTFIDPFGLGDNLPDFSSLAAHHEMLGIGQPLVDDEEIEQELRRLTRHITHRRRQGYSNSGEESGGRTDENTESYRVLVVLDFPEHFTPRAARELLTIAHHGPRYGVSTIVVTDPERSSLPVDFDLDELERDATVIEWNGQRFFFQDWELQDWQLELDAPPPPVIFKYFLEKVDQQVRASISVEQNPLLRKMLGSPHWQEPGESVQTLLGHPIAATREPVAVPFQRESGSNLLIAGRQEDLAIGMFIAAMISLTAQSSPKAAQFYLVDLNMMSGTNPGSPGPFDGVGQFFPQYIKRFAHRRNVRDVLPQILTEIWTELGRRSSAGGDAPALYLFICGLHRADEVLQKEAWTGGNSMPSNAARQFALILRKGPDVGIHTLAWSDRYSSLRSVLGDQPLEDFEHRVVFRTLTEEDSMRLIGNVDACTLGLDDALFFDRGQVEKFRPYGAPSREWMEWAAGQVGRKREM
jgi:serine/threonine protein kinase